jgi:hypothetical protein
LRSGPVSTRPDILPATTKPVPTPGEAVGGRPSATARVLGVCLFLVIALQRFALPVGPEGISLTLVLGLLCVLALVLSGGLAHDPVRVILFTVAAAACGLATWLVALSSGQGSLNSYLLLVVVYLPWLFRVPLAQGSRTGAAWISALFVKIMLGFGLVAIAQLAAQMAGVWTYSDPLEGVPQQWLLADFNTTIPIEYASPIMKSQGVLFLEPSFLCQFLAVAVVIGIMRRVPLWQLLVLGVAMFCTYSGTGMVLLVAGLVLILVRSPRKIRPSMVILAALAVIALVLSPFAAPLLARSAEAGDSSSSLSLRFVEPYQQVAGGLQADTVRYLTGAGAGTAERLLENDREGSGKAVVYTVAPKLLFEYGMVAGSSFLLFMLVTLLRRGPSRVVPGALVVMLGFLSGSLLQPHTLLVAWLLTAAWSRE